MADAEGAARELVDALFPQAQWAVLAGSVLTPLRTAGSDLDIVVVLPSGSEAFRESRHWQGWPVELFVHDPQTFDRYVARDIERRQPSLCRMVALGRLIRHTPEADAVIEQCRSLLAAGPAPLTEAELQRQRYTLTDLLDDLVHATDPGERLVTAAVAWMVAAQFVLAYRRHWQGGGKWLLRELADLDADLAQRWLAAHNDPDAVAAFATAVLDEAGGPLFDGYRLQGT